MVRHTNENKLPPIGLEERFQLVQALGLIKGVECFHVIEKRSPRKECLIRVLPEDVAKDRLCVDEFHRFFTAFSEIPNRNHVPAVYGSSGVVGGTVYVVEEYVPGISLADFVEQSKGSSDFPRQLLDAVTRVCEGLHYAHQKGLFHLCITPQDILINLDDPRKTKLVGFGTQIFVKSGAVKHLLVESRKYLAPELIDGGPPGPSADMYSLTVCLKEIRSSIENDKGFFSKCLSRDLSSRPSRPREFAQRLRAFLDGEGPREKFSTQVKLQPGGLRPLLRIMTDPLGAEVKSEGKVLGITTASGLSVPWKQGTTIEVVKPGFQPETLCFSAPPSQTDIRVKLTSALKLLTNPWGATVLVDGKPIGQTTREGIVVPWEGHVIEIQKAGYTSETIRLKTAPSSTDTAIELQPLAPVKSTANEMNWIEVAGYLVAGIALLFLPLLAYMATIGGSQDAVVAEKDKEITALSKQYDESNKKNLSLQNEKDSLQKHLASLGSEKQKIASEKTSIESKLKQSETEKNEKEKSLRTTQNDLNSERNNLRKANQEIEALKQTNHALQSKIDGLTRSAAQAQSRSPVMIHVPLLGIDVADAYGKDEGAEIRQVYQGTPASYLKTGSTITKFNDKIIRNANDLYQATRTYYGKYALIELWAGTHKVELHVRTR